MNRIVFSQEGEIRPAAVVGVGLVLSAVAFAINTLIADAAPPALGAPDEVSQFGFVKVVLATIPAVLGNTLGFYLSYRRHDPRALAKFLAPAAGFYGPVLGSVPYAAVNTMRGWLRASTLRIGLTHIAEARACLQFDPSAPLAGVPPAAVGRGAGVAS